MTPAPQPWIEGTLSHPHNPDAAGVAAYYDFIAREYSDAYQSARAAAEDEVTADLLRKFVPGRPVLDVGCGDGLAVRLAGYRPQDYLGVDVSPGMIEQAERLHPEHLFRVEDACQLDVPEATFDGAISLYGSFSHFPDPEAAVGGIADALRYGAPALVMACGPAWKPSGFDWEAQPDVFFRRYAAEELEHLFRKRFRRVSTFGLSMVTHRLPALVAGPWRRALVAWEAALAGRRWPDRCQYVCVYGRRA